MRGFDGAARGVTHNGMTHPSRPWIAAFCALLSAPGSILVWPHNRRVITENENRLPA